MRKLLAGALLAVSGAAQAASGIYSGIWQDSGGRFVLLMHSGDNVIATTYNNFPVIGRSIVVPLANGQTYYPSSLDVGDLLSGAISNGRGVLSGIAAFRACVISYEITFYSSTSAALRYVGAAQTQDGALQGINCLSLYAYSGYNPNALVPITKIF